MRDEGETLEEVTAKGFEILHSPNEVYAFKAFPERFVVLKQAEDELFYLHRTHEK